MVEPPKTNAKNSRNSSSQHGLKNKESQCNLSAFDNSSGYEEYHSEMKEGARAELKLRELQIQVPHKFRPCVIKGGGCTLPVRASGDEEPVFKEKEATDQIPFSYSTILVDM